MIPDKQAKNIAAKIRRGKASRDEVVWYDRWAKAGKGRRPRTQLTELLTARKRRQASEDLLPKQKAPEADWFDDMVSQGKRERAGFDNPAPITGETIDVQSVPADHLREQYAKKEPIAPPLPPLDGEIVEPIAPPIELPEAPIPGFDLGGGIAKGARAVLEAIDKHNPEIGGIALASMLGEKFWPAWEAAAERLIAKYAGPMNLADDELVVGGAAVVVAQPIAIPYVKQHGGAWLAKIKRAVGFGGVE